jgi:hypothetical protein
MPLLTLALDESEWSASRFTPWEIASHTRWVGSWMGPRSRRDDVERRKYLLFRESNPDFFLLEPFA